MEEIKLKKSEKVNITDENGEELPYSYSLKYNIDDLFNNTKTRFFGYARVSTERQRENDSSITTQISYIEDECARRNFSLVAIYVDDGISGNSSTLREGYKCMLRNIKNNVSSFKNLTVGIMIFNLSRATRSIMDKEIFCNFIIDEELLLHIITAPHINLRTPEGRGQLDMTVMFDKQLRDNAVRNTTLSMREKVEKGTLRSRITYGSDKDGKPISIEQEGINLIRTLHDSGKENYEILETMNNGYINENNEVIKIPYNNGEGRRKTKDENKIGIWTRSVIDSIIDKYVCSKRTKIGQASVLHKDENVKNCAIEMLEENPKMSYSEIARRINEKCMYNCIIKPNYISKLLKSKEENNEIKSYNYETYKEILKIQNEGVISNSGISTKLNKLKIAPPGKGLQWYHNTVDSFIKKCLKDPPIKTSWSKGLSDTTDPDIAIKNEDGIMKLQKEVEIKILEEKLRKEYEEKLRIEVQSMEKNLIKEFEEKLKVSNRKSRYNL
jgi:DNA invertase Pin-like site-specific DNA recombinase